MDIKEEKNCGFLHEEYYSKPIINDIDIKIQNYIRKRITKYNQKKIALKLKIIKYGERARKKGFRVKNASYALDNFT